MVTKNCPYFELMFRSWLNKSLYSWWSYFKTICVTIWFVPRDLTDELKVIIQLTLNCHTFCSSPRTGVDTRWSGSDASVPLSPRIKKLSFILLFRTYWKTKGLLSVNIVTDMKPWSFVLMVEMPRAGNFLLDNQYNQKIITWNMNPASVQTVGVNQ